MAPTAESWHEAGHALAAHLLGARVNLLTLESELDGHGGHAEIDWTGVSNQTRGSALVALAGPVAELVYRGEEILDACAAQLLQRLRGDTCGDGEACGDHRRDGAPS